MARDVVMPRLGWTMETGTVVEWLKQSGDPIEAGELLLSVESDKAITEVEALDSGIVYVPPDSPVGIEVPVGAIVGFILAPNEDPPTSGLGNTTAAAKLAPAQTASLPQQPPGTPPSANPAATASPRARRVASELGVDLAFVTGTGKDGRIRESDVRAVVSEREIDKGPRVSPSVRRLAEASGVDLSQVPSSGPAGRITRADLKALQNQQLPGTGVPMSAFRRAISERMSAGVHDAAPVTLTTEVDVRNLVGVRESIKRDSDGIVPSYNDLLVKLTALALRTHPNLNASLHESEIVEHDNINIGLAVDTDRGLLAPVVTDADARSVIEIAATSHDLIERARSGAITRQELIGATFTLTNLGMYGIDAFTPIINLPECAVLGVGRIVHKPVVTDVGTETIGVRPMMALSLTFDHRVVDGAPAARFLQTVAAMIAQPTRWLMS